MTSSTLSGSGVTDVPPSSASGPSQGLTNESRPPSAARIGSRAGRRSCALIPREGDRWADVGSFGDSGLEQVGGRHSPIKHAEFNPARAVDGVASKHEPTTCRSGELVAHDLDGTDREHHTDGHFGKRGTQRDVGDQSNVTAQSQHEPAGDGMPIDRTDDQAGTPRRRRERPD